MLKWIGILLGLGLLVLFLEFAAGFAVLGDSGTLWLVVAAVVIVVVLVPLLISLVRSMGRIRW